MLFVHDIFFSKKTTEIQAFFLLKKLSTLKMLKQLQQHTIKIVNKPFIFHQMFIHM